MHLFSLFIILMRMLAANGAKTTSVTLVWATGTNADGVLTTTQSAFSQTFMDIHTTAAPVPSGTMGLGSISGEVGNVRSYARASVSSSGSVGFYNANREWIHFLPLIAISVYGLGLLF